MSSEKGFKKHSESSAHIKAMVMWTERDRRKETGASISTLLNDTVLERNRKYMRIVAEIIIFLAVNELPYRGEYLI